MIKRLILFKNGLTFQGLFKQSSLKSAIFTSEATCAQTQQTPKEVANPSAFEAKQTTPKLIL